MKYRASYLRITTERVVVGFDARDDEEARRIAERTAGEDMAFGGVKRLVPPFFTGRHTELEDVQPDPGQ